MTIAAMLKVTDGQPRSPWAGNVLMLSNAADVIITKPNRLRLT
jgi:hypothetical protein